MCCLFRYTFKNHLQQISWRRPTWERFPHYWPFVWDNPPWCQYCHMDNLRCHQWNNKIGAMTTVGFCNCPSATLKQMTLRIFNHMFIYLYLLWTLNLVTVFLWLANRKEVPQQQSGALPCTPRGHYSTSHELCTRFALVMFHYNLLQAEFSHTQCKPGNPEPVMHTWRISVNKSHGSNNIFTTTQTKQSATKPCVYVIMMTSSNGSFSALLAHCVGNSPVTGGGFSSQRASNGDFDVSLM